MNVLFVNYDDFRSNSAVHIFNLARELSSLGHSCCVAVPQDKETISALGVPNFTVRDFGDIRRTDCGFLDENGPSLIHAWTPRQIVRAFVDEVVKLFRCPYVVHLEDNERYLLETALARPFSELAGLPLGQLDSVVPPHLSHPIYSARFLQNAAGITVIIDRLLEFVPPGTPAVVTLAGFESELFRPVDIDNALRVALGIPDGTTTIVYHGNTHAANIAEVRSLYLAAIVLTRTGMPTKLVRLGRNFVPMFETEPPELAEIEIYAGFQPRGDLPRYLSLADVLVQPGIPDAFNDYRLPSKVPEFLAMGKPVVLPRTNIGLMMEVGQHALLLEQGTAFEIAEAIRRIVTDRSLAERLSIGGRGFAQERLMWSAIAKRVERLYVKVNGRLVEPPTSRTAASVYERYRSFSCPPLSYGTVRDFCDSFDHLPLLATMTLDLKDVQRPWVFKAIVGHIPRGSHLLEIGAGEPVVADILSTLGYEVWVVDPYDGRDRGPSDFQGLQERYPRVRFLRGLFPEACPQDMRFACIYSISVLEHIPTEAIDIVADGMERSLASADGYLIHAIDHALRGSGDSYHLRNITHLLKRFGFDQSEIDQVLAKVETDVETYFLSAESHNRWRGDTPYDEFPMRKCVSLHICKRMSQPDLTPGMAGWDRKARADAAILRGDAPHSPPAAATAAEPAPALAPAPCEPVAAVPARETLMGAQLRIVGAQTPIVVLDIGAHHGHSTAEYLDNFQNCRAFAFEPDVTNFAAAQTLLAGRAEVLNVAVSDRVGTATFHVNSHDGTHSLYEIGAQRYWGGFAEAVTTVEVPTTTVDCFCAERGMDRVDILKMDIQGGELAALKGAAGLLSRQAIGVITLEVLFQPLYKDQPMFWDLSAYLATHAYALYGLFDNQYHSRNDRVLSWADAIFLAPRYLDVPEWERA